MTHDQFDADRSLMLLPPPRAPSTPETMTVWAIVAFLLVLAMLVIGGPS